MGLSPIPNITSRRGVVIAAAVVTVVVWIAMAARFGDITTGLGDTDDATRLTLVHDMLAGHGWYDQRIGRFWPPTGVFLHWSRLIDGPLAALMWLLARVVSPPTAELFVRYAWPQLWVFPAVAAALFIARDLGARGAVFLAALVLMTLPQAFVQFLPGRVDHHNIQIAMALIAFAAAVAPGNAVRNAAIAGVATGFGLAIGLEALFYHALIGAGFALRLASGDDRARPTAAYGASLGIASLGLFALQTPPARWSLTFCDALAVNLALALAVAGVGLAIAGIVAARWGRIASWVALALAGIAAAGVYLGLDPNCLHGPFAEMDPRVRPFWFDHINEMQPWWISYKNEATGAMQSLFMIIMAIAGWLMLFVRPEARRQPGPWLAGPVVLMACAVGFQAHRMLDYAFWFGAVTFAAGVSVASERWLRGRMLPSAIAAIMLSPSVLALGHAEAMTVIKPKTAAEKSSAARDSVGDGCFDTRAYAPLRRLPTGVILADIDYGPYVTALTDHGVVQAPYHRMTTPILAAHVALQAPPAKAETLIRALRATYLLDCRRHLTQEDAGSLMDALRHGAAPTWLTQVSAPKATLTVWRILPPSR